MFHRGEKGCAYFDRCGVWHSVIVLVGVADLPRPAAGVLAVLRRRSDGVRLIVWPGGAVEEVAG